MNEIDAALRSLEDSLERLSSRFRGSVEDATRLFRARLLLDQAQASIAAAAVNDSGAGDWSAGLTELVNNASMRVAVVPSIGGETFDAAMEAVSEALRSISAALGKNIP